MEFLKILFIRQILLFLIILSVGSAAHAACTNPAAQAGDIIYNADHKVFQYCNDTSWIAASAISSGTGGCTNPAEPEGSIFYNGDHRVLQGCAGDRWLAMGLVGGSELPWRAVSAALAANNPSPNVNDYFGRSVAVSGTVAVVGARDDESDGGAGVSDAGRAYAFDTTTGALIATLNNPSPNGDDFFDRSVAVSGTVAVVGARFDESDGGAGVSAAGRGYVFKPGGLGTCYSPTRDAGYILYYSARAAVQYCDGANWVVKTRRHNFNRCEVGEIVNLEVIMEIM